MQKQERIAVNVTMMELRRMIAYLDKWRTNNPYADQRHTAMVITKLEEAELLAQRMTKEPKE